MPQRYDDDTYIGLYSNLNINLLKSYINGLAQQEKIYMWTTPYTINNVHNHNHNKRTEGSRALPDLKESYNNNNDNNIDDDNINDDSETSENGVNG